MTKLMNITDGVERYMFVQKDEKMLAADAIRREKRAQARAERAASEASGTPTPERAPRAPRAKKEEEQPAKATEEQN